MGGARKKNMMQLLFPKVSLVHFLMPGRANSVERMERANDERLSDEALLGGRDLYDRVDPFTAIIKKMDPEEKHTKQLMYSKQSPSQQSTVHHEVRSTWEPPYRPVINRDQDSQIAVVSSEEVNTTSDESGILDQFASSQSFSRRSKLSQQKSGNPLQVYSPNQSSPASVEELYSATLPEVRNKLRREGLRQVGFVTPLKHLNRMNSLTDEELFYRNRYRRMQVDPNDPSASKHNPFKPLAYRDSTLDAFAPKQWTGSHPPPATDDLLRQAIKNLRTDFNVAPKRIYRKPSATEGDVPAVRYFFSLRFLQRALTGSNSVIKLLLQVNVSHPSSGRTLSQLQRHIDIYTEDEIQPVITGELTAITKSGLSGQFRVTCQVFLIPSTSDEEEASVLLKTHPPCEVQILQIS